MTMTPPGSGRPAPKKRGRGRAYLFITTLIFGVGFWAGNVATRKVQKEGHPLLQKALGVESVPAQASPALPTQSASIQKPAPAAQPQPQTAAPTAPLDTQPTSTGQQPRPTEPEESLPPNADELDKQVRDYNLILRQIREAYTNFQAARKINTNPNLKAEEQDKAINDQSDAAEKLVRLVQNAQTLYDYIHGQSQFNKRYKEVDRAIAASDLPTSLPEMSVDNLKFIRPR
jgi:type IV secretory pathway VirB10-like protein